MIPLPVKGKKGKKGKKKKKGGEGADEDGEEGDEKGKRGASAYTYEYASDNEVDEFGNRKKVRKRRGEGAQEIRLTGPLLSPAFEEELSGMRKQYDIHVSDSAIERILAGKPSLNKIGLKPEEEEIVRIVVEGERRALQDLPYDQMLDHVYKHAGDLTK